jgi:hypothetical protein
MSRVLAWLRQLDQDALGGRAFAPRAVLVPLRLAIGLLVGGGVGFLAGVYLGLLRTPEPVTYNIALPYVSSIVGALGGAGLGLALSLRATGSRQ